MVVGGSRGAADEDLAGAEGDQMAGPVRDGHALALRRVVVFAGLVSLSLSSAVFLVLPRLPVVPLLAVRALAFLGVSLPSPGWPRPLLSAATLARRISVRSAAWVLGSGSSMPSGRTTSLPSTLAWTTASSASRWAAWDCSRSK